MDSTLPGFKITKGLRCLVTGGSGFVGRRLVEMLVERGARRVISFDVAPKPVDAIESSCIEYVKVIILFLYLLILCSSAILISLYFEHCREISPMLNLCRIYVKTSTAFSI